MIAPPELRFTAARVSLPGIVGAETPDMALGITAAIAAATMVVVVDVRIMSAPAAWHCGSGHRHLRRRCLATFAFRRADLIRAT